MNLVISGPIDATLRNALVMLVKPRNVVRLHARAARLETDDDSPPSRATVANHFESARVHHAETEPGKT